MQKVIDFYNTHSAIIHKIGIGILLLIALIIIISFIRKHKVASFLIILISGAFVSFYFLNISIGFHFTSSLSSSSIRANLESQNYEIEESNNFTIYMQKSKIDDKIVSTRGDFFAVKKMAFFYIEAKPTTTTYEITLDRFAEADVVVDLIVQEIKVSNQCYYYSFKIDYYDSTVLDSIINKYPTLTQYFINEVEISGKIYNVENLYFVKTEEAATKDNLKIFGQSVKEKTNQNGGDNGE